MAVHRIGCNHVSDALACFRVGVSSRGALLRGGRLCGRICIGTRFFCVGVCGEGGRARRGWGAVRAPGRVVLWCVRGLRLLSCAGGLLGRGRAPWGRGGSWAGLAFAPLSLCRGCGSARGGPVRPVC